MNVSLPNIPTGAEGFTKIAELHASMQDSGSQQIEIDMSSAKWVAANMCSALEAILYGERAGGTDMRIVNVRPEVRAIMQKNGFLCQYGYERLADPNNTSFGCVRFARHESHDFTEYVRRNFYKGGRGLPDMSDRLLKRFRESIGELFDNAKDHSESELGVFTCGQFFPRKGKLDFCMTDRGIGICKNVRKHLDLELSPLGAIEWALQGENSTRPFRDQKTGGLGLKLIREFVRMNRGRIIIVSDGGYWEFQADKEKTAEFDLPFPGTAVTFEINTSDTRSYCLMDEIDPRDIW